MHFGGRTLHWPDTSRDQIIWLLLLIGIFLFMRAAAGTPMAVLATFTGVAGYGIDRHFYIQYTILLVAMLAFVFRSRQVRRVTARQAAGEGILLSAGFVLYELGRMLFVGDFTTAERNASRVVALERRFGGAFESSWQQTVLGHDHALESFNRVYSFMFIPIVIGVLFWLLIFDDASYRILRTSLGIAALLALTTIALFPVAPPRLLPGSNVIDTHRLLGGKHGFVNQFAAVPSLHVGWSIAAGFALCRSLRNHRWRHLAYAPGVLMAVTVIVTGNHFWFDAVIGVCFTLGPAILLSNRADATAARRGVHRVSAWSAARAAIAQSSGAQFSICSLGLLLAYLVLREPITPNFTHYWGYQIAQIAATIAAVAYLSTKLAPEGGLSWPTHIIVVTVTYADTFGTAGHFYDRFATYDKITHFGGGASLAAAAYDILYAMNVRGRISWSPSARVLVATLIPVALGVSWEIYEYLGDSVFNTGRNAGGLDTTYDIISDTTGAFLTCLIMWRRELKQTVAEFQPKHVFGRTGPSSG
ncbi:MAG: phosphatase PAP2 family protein [Thermomicrobiales bacterium]